MAITRRFQAGAEVDTTNSFAVEYDVNAGVTCDATQKKSGAYSFYFNDSLDNLEKFIPGTLQCRAGLHLRITTRNTGTAQWVIALRSRESVVAGVRNVPSQDQLELYVNGAAQATKFSYSLNTWYRLGLDVKIAAAGGWARVYIDGVEVIPEDSDNTGTSEIDAVKHGPKSGSGTNDIVFRLDDVYVDDTTGESAATIPPDLRFEYSPADGNGNYSQWDGSDGNQVDNYLQVDERPYDSDTTYNEAQAADEIDSYATTPYVVPGGWKTQAFIPCAVARKTDAATVSQLAMLTREGGVDDEGSSQDPGSSYGLLWERFTTDPGGSKWKKGSLAAVEIGVQAEGTF